MWCRGGVEWQPASQWHATWTCLTLSGPHPPAPLMPGPRQLEGHCPQPTSLGLARAAVHRASVPTLALRPPASALSPSSSVGLVPGHIVSYLLPSLSPCVFALHFPTPESSFKPQLVPDALGVPMPGGRGDGAGPALLALTQGCWVSPAEPGAEDPRGRPPLLGERLRAAVAGWLGRRSHWAGIALGSQVWSRHEVWRPQAVGTWHGRCLWRQDSPSSLP